MTFQNKISKFSQSDHSHVLTRWMNTVILWQLIKFGTICINSRDDWCWHIIDCACWNSCFADRSWFVSPKYLCVPVHWCERCMFRTVMLRKHHFLMKLKREGFIPFGQAIYRTALSMVFISHLPGLKLAQKCLQCSSCRVSSVWRRHREITTAV